jgi:diguanylate cyclase (GGDEF)-like protein
MLEGDGPFVRVAKWSALCMAVLIAFGVPGGYLYFGYERLGGQIAAEINFKANHVTRLITGNPEFWQYESVRIVELIKDTSLNTDSEFNRVMDNDGNVVAQYPAQRPEFHWPVIARHQPLFDYGTKVGRIETIHSLRFLYERTIAVGLFSLLTGLVLYWGLRIVPLRLLRRAWDQVSYLAGHDALTGLPNRVTLLDRLQQALAGETSTRGAVTVYSLDLDRFKEVNDTLGHAAGDQLLIQAAKRMKACLRQEDTLARLGGDEFAIIQPGMSSPQTAADVAERIISALSKTFQLDGQETHIGASIGITINSEDTAIRPDQLLIKSDLALYRSKNEGRGTYRFFQEEMNADLLARKAIERDLRAALDRNELELHYQPQVNLSDQRIVGIEALLRWHHPERGNVPPATIIPIAETSGLMRPLTEWVLRRACRDALNWKPLKVAVNLSPSLFLENSLGAMVKRILQETGLPPELLELEITEEILMADTDRILVTLNELRDIGVRIVMDDFGTGYSSLSYLRKFPFDKIKIDRSFVNEVNDNVAAKEIVRAIINMGHALKMQINGEGVETIEQAQILLGEGCEEVQGYFYGRPMKKDDINMLLSMALSPIGPSAMESNGAGTEAERHESGMAAAAEDAEVDHDPLSLFGLAASRER